MAVKRILLQKARIVSGGGGVGPIFTEDFYWNPIPDMVVKFTEDFSGWPG